MVNTGVTRALFSSKIRGPTVKINRLAWIALLFSGTALVTPANAQSVEVDEVQVVGFRASLASALETKRADNTLIDVIKAEDFADFPDLNIAEALQRVPGVAIDRDGGEGRSITVRGLSGDFSRVRLNGFEALATTGGKDGSGGANRGRGFDFQVFASDLFNSLAVRKTASADVEEGSLGATVDLTTSGPTASKTLTLRGRITTATGPFSLVLTIDALNANLQILRA